MQVLTTPILNTVRTFDATNAHTVTFDVFGGDRVFANELVIDRVADNVEVYRGWEQTTNTTHSIPPNTLANGINYRAKIRTQNISGEESSYSDNVIFWCYAEPEVYIVEGIDYDNQNRVYSQTVMFKASYLQADYESMQSYRYILYNDNKQVLNTFPEKFNDGSEFLEQEIAKLENGKEYYLEVKTLSPSGNMGSSGLIRFRPFYIAPTLTATIKPENLEHEGGIKVSANVVQIIMTLFDDKGVEVLPEDIEYIDGDLIDMNRPDYKKLIADKAFDITRSNFILRIWAKNIPENSKFLSLYTQGGYLDVYRRKGIFTAYKGIRNMDAKDYYCSNDFDQTNDQLLMIQIKQIDNMLDIRVEAE